MKVTYIGHSGFLIETKDCYWIFDYYTGVLPNLRPDKAVFVFSSHAHQDHYTTKIFDMLRAMGMKDITAVLSDDISPAAYPRDREELTILPVSCHGTYELPYGTTVHTFRSTDEGVAFLVRCSEGTVYHAGDLNDWVWPGESEEYNRSMAENYRQEIGLLKRHCQEYLNGHPIDIACVPLDPRQEEYYALGMLGFLKEIPVAEVYPMHFWDQPDVIGRFLTDYPEYEHLIKNTMYFK